MILACRAALQQQPEAAASPPRGARVIKRCCWCAASSAGAATRACPLALQRITDAWPRAGRARRPRTDARHLHSGYDHHDRGCCYLHAAALARLGGRQALLDGAVEAREEGGRVDGRQLHRHARPRHRGGARVAHAPVQTQAHIHTLALGHVGHSLLRAKPLGPLLRQQRRSAPPQVLLLRLGHLRGGDLVLLVEHQRDEQAALGAQLLLVRLRGAQALVDERARTCHHHHARDAAHLADRRALAVGQGELELGEVLFALNARPLRLHRFLVAQVQEPEEAAAAQVDGHVLHHREERVGVGRAEGGADDARDGGGSSDGGGRDQAAVDEHAEGAEGGLRLLPQLGRQVHLARGQH
mmetsp:Transcript_2411/g.8698  ORF Transcript_2411/g.8698 Transcript_2411/m.8698 type:complete len:355 (+) Transcript_2411:1277-2341(+)